jgi:hypothetical protein
VFLPRFGNCRNSTPRPAGNPNSLNSLRLASLLHNVMSRIPKTVLKIETIPDGRQTILRLSGRIESQHVQDLKLRTGGGTHELVLDLEEVRVVDLDVVHFLAVCQAKGITLRHCPPYIREWIVTEKARIREFE